MTLVARTPAAAPQFADAVGDFNFILRTDGIKQWTYKGKGLYTYAGDKAPGDMEGNATGEWQGRRNGFRAFYIRDEFGRGG